MSYHYTLFLILVFLATNCAAQSPQVRELLQQAEAHKDKPEYTDWLLKADSAAGLDLATRASINQKLGHFYFNTDPDKSIHHLRNATSYYRLTNNKPQVALCLQNTAFAMDEGKFNIAAAIPYAEQALDAWQELDDTLQMANMYKYLGLLQGKISRTAEGKANINKAIELYRAKGNGAGVAVSLHNMAVVHQYLRAYSYAIAALNEAKAYWQNTDSSRLFEVNNLLMEMHLLRGDTAAVPALYNENLALYNDKYYYRDRLNFYRNAIDYYRQTGNEAAVNKHLEQYNTLHAALVKKGLIRY